MARKRFPPNFLYGGIGLALLGTATYYASRTMRRRDPHAKDAMMSLRRSTRNVGRTVKDSADKIGKETERAATDARQAFGDAGSGGQPAESSPSSFNGV